MHRHGGTVYTSDLWWAASFARFGVVLITFLTMQVVGAVNVRRPAAFSAASVGLRLIVVRDVGDLRVESCRIDGARCVHAIIVKMLGRIRDRKHHIKERAAII